MLEEFEKALCDGKNLDAVAQMLISKANEDRQNRIRQIEHDKNLASLIREGLNEPSDTTVFSVCKSFIRTYKRKHCPGGSKKLVAQLMDESEERKETP